MKQGLEGKIYQARSNWLEASVDLGFRITTPFDFDFKGVNYHAFAFLPESGGLYGVIVDLIFPPGFEANQIIEAWATESNCAYSFVNIEVFLSYSKNVYKEMLLDWRHITSSSHNRPTLHVSSSIQIQSPTAL
jgi:hypothetical protein